MSKHSDGATDECPKEGNKDQYWISTNVSEKTRNSCLRVDECGLWTTWRKWGAGENIIERL